MKKLEKGNLGPIAGGGTTKNRMRASVWKFDTIDQLRKVADLMTERGFKLVTKVAGHHGLADSEYIFLNYETGDYFRITDSDEAAAFRNYEKLGRSGDWLLNIDPNRMNSIKEQKMDNLEKVAGGGPTPNRGKATVFRFGSQAQRLATQEALGKIGFCGNV